VLERAIRDGYDRGRSRWPTAGELAVDDFVAHVTLKVPPDEEPLAYVATLVLDDLYLACACLHDVPGAIRIFDDEYLARVPEYVRTIDRSQGFGDEMRQVLRERLLVRRDHAPARIADYSGRGALASWLRVTAVRVALNHRATPEQARPHDDSGLADQLANDAGPELELLHARYATAITDALRVAIGSLPAEQRVILRMYFAAGHSTQQIAELLRVDRSTAARRLVAARRAVFDATHRLLRAQLALETTEFASLARALHDRLDVSLSGLFAEPA
jgi:RNA polymerase sigma-70 factor